MLSEPPGRHGWLIRRHVESTARANSSFLQGATRVVETLTRTGGFRANVARHRLFETTQHILQCTMSKASIQPGGAGHASSVRVRLLHAAVRSRIMKLVQQDPNYYDVASLGVPINDLDCIATIGAFHLQHSKRRQSSPNQSMQVRSPLR